MRRFLTFTLMILAFLSIPSLSNAQFGKNQVIWEKTTWNFYQSSHFDFYFSLDIDSERSMVYLEKLESHLEGSYQNLSAGLKHALKRRPVVVVSRTHSTFEALHLTDGFMPEGVGAYAFPRSSKLLPGSDLILAVKPDFLPVLNRTIFTHELVHIFQFDMVGWSFLRGSNGNSIAGWVWEATADYLANLYAPYSRDDIRQMQKRLAAANVKNPMFGLPTLGMLRSGHANPYSLGSMPFEFIEAEYGREKILKLISDIFKSHKKFEKLLFELSGGQFYNREAFDRAHRDFWNSKYAQDSLDRDQIYEDTVNFKGTQIIKKPFPYPLTSPSPSPDGKFVAFITLDRKYGIVIAVAKIFKKDSPIKFLEKDEDSNDLMNVGGRQTPSPPPDRPEIRILTRFVPPKPYESIIAQQINVWPFNGSDFGWWQSPEDIVEQNKAEAELEKEKNKTKELSPKGLLAYFARKNRDHALFVFDVSNEKLVHQIEIPLDQSFSPMFSPDGSTVYFSAAKNIDRNLYSINLKTKEIKQITKSGIFNTAPVISPDGSQLAYIAFVGGFQKMFLLDLTSGQTKQVTFGRYNDNSPSWSHDGKLLVFTSDKKDSIWNLYTYRLEDGNIKQWTGIFGGVFTPKFYPGRSDRVIVSAYIEQDQFESYIYSNSELFDLNLKEPMVSFSSVDTKENMDLVFNPQDLVAESLDRRQIESRRKAPSRWNFSGSNMEFSSSKYWGMFGYSRFLAQDLLGNQVHYGSFAKGGDVRFVDYFYLNQSKRWSWALAANNSQLPLFYSLYSPSGQRPRYPSPDGSTNQYTLSTTWFKESSLTFYTQYPFSKWDRLEFGVKTKTRSFLLDYQLPENLSQEELSLIPPSDVQLYNFFTKSSGQANLGLSVAFVHDTVLYSEESLGPLNGNALRAQVEYGPGLNKKSSSYHTLSVDARRYLRLGATSSLLATRFAGTYSNRPTGEAVFMGGDGQLRNYPYFSIIGNQVAVMNTEFRLPFAEGAILGAIPFKLRGLAFGDYAVARFSQDIFPTRKEWAYGFGLQSYAFGFPMSFEWARTKFDPDRFTFNFRVGLSF